MNKVDDEHGKPNKNTLNLLVYFGMKKFDIRFLVIYILGAVVVCIITNFILNAGHMSAYWWWSSIITGLLIGTIMYFWDLKKSRQTVTKL